eukprot:TRINITY_DN9967_c0_g1_i1.p1 TRINITY_DN9967_c0_g1~~TRINITY_DN9967_c0_g1_i1.p1  ORF type:complete len:760 (+),score=160.71 TRINITY_DN9967_c0_g1_i1:206-2485(+)
MAEGRPAPARRRRRREPPAGTGWTVAAAAALALLLPRCDAVTCDERALLNNIRTCSLVCCGRQTCDCMAALIEDGVQLPDNSTRIDITQYCQYVTCLSEAISGCPDEIAGNQVVASFWNFSNVDTSGHGGVTRINHCNSLPCSWRQLSKLRQCIGFLECRSSGAEQCSAACVGAMVRCLETSDCIYFWADEAACRADAWTDCEGFCPAVIALHTPAPTPAPPPPGAEEVNMIIVVVMVGVGAFLAGSLALWLWRRRQQASVVRDDVITPADKPGADPLHVEPMRADSMSFPAQSARVSPLPNPRGQFIDVAPAASLRRPSSHSLRRSKSGISSSNGGELITPAKTPGVILHALSKGKWTKGQLLGRGQFGSVYLALLPQGQAVAVKMVDGSQQDEAENSEMVREIETMRELSHPYIVKYYFASYVAQEQLINIFMEYVPGGSLARLVRQMDAVLGEAQASVYTSQILQGLQYLHDHSIVHRDIKGDNVLVDTSEGTCKISDFGSSKKHVQGTLQASAAAGTIAGTPNWMAPEMITQQGSLQPALAAKVDVWSVGCTVVEILNRGKPPWPPFQSLWAAVYHITHAEGLPEGIPETLSDSCRDFVERCLRRDPVERPSATELLSHPFVLGEEPTTADSGSGSSEPANVDEKIGELLEENRRMKSMTPQPRDLAADGQAQPTPISAALRHCNSEGTVSPPPSPAAAAEPQPSAASAGSGDDSDAHSAAERRSSAELRHARVSPLPLIDANGDPLPREGMAVG